MNNPQSKLFLLFCCGSLLLAGFLQANETELPMEGFTEGGYESCVKCHQSDQVKAMFNTKHANLDDPETPFAKEQCESCHGPSAAHASFPMQVKNFRFGDESGNSMEEQNQACLKCHQDERRDQWGEGEHHKEQVSCVSCHTIHDEHDVLLDHTQTAMTCLECHDTRVAEQHTEGLHLIQSDEVTCTDCHNPHAKLSGDLCITCHEQDKETLASQSAKAQEFHQASIDEELSCLECHRGVAHGVPDWVRELQDQQKSGDD